MREILFRGKTLTNRWVEGAYYKQEYFYGDKEDAHIIITSKENLTYDQGLDFCIVIPETVGQFTGLTDKNGKKIFEGDIVEINEDICTDFCVCFWNEYNYEFGFKNKYMDFGIAYAPHDIEVIGNIHDNPELLKGGAE